ncbi:hypothetical protein [uncultured Albimonas sp.]|uniref:DUF4870 family protein n=1 Tax=uncultured Albimonas sp. TaxID=1331701 RepID=UPI0030EBF1EC|tara:strand:- start:2522 stop:2944 length:423 start_codon:yes stop_codon:yes gene_type:complete
MSDPTPHEPRPSALDDPAPRAAEPAASPSRLGGWDAVKLVYVLYLVGFAVPLCALAGVVIAYAKRDEAPPAEASHMAFQIRSFWVGLAAIVLGSVLTLVLVGWLVMAAWAVWAVARFVTGLLKALDAKPVSDPEGYGFAA